MGECLDVAKVTSEWRNSQPKLTDNSYLVQHRETRAADVETGVERMTLCVYYFY